MAARGEVGHHELLGDVVSVASSAPCLRQFRPHVTGPVLLFLDGTAVRTESNPPYDLAGDNAIASPFDSTSLANGSHVVETVYVVNDVERRTTARFNVAN